MPSFRGGKGAIAKELGGPLDSAGKDGGKRFGGGMRAGIAGMATKVFAPLAAAAGTVALGGWVKGAVAEASGLGESLNALDVVYGESSKGIQALGEGAASALGLSNLEFNNLAVRFSGFSNTIAGEGGNVVGTLDDLTTRASDFASVMNLDVAEAATLFQSGLAGETEPLRQFGIDMSAAAVEAYALENGIASSAGSMTEAEKVQARYGLLMESTAQTQGDFANTSDSLANQQRILSSRWSDLSAMAGTALLPAITGVVGAVNGMLGAFLAADTPMQGLKDAWSSLTDSFGGGEGIFDGIRGALESAFDSAVSWLSGGGIQAIFEGLLSGRERLFDAAMQLFPAIVEALVAFVPVLIDSVAQMIPQVAAFLLSSVPMLLTAAVTLFTSLIQGIAVVLPQLVTTITTLIPQLVGVLLTMVPVLLQTAITLFMTLLQAVITVLPQLLTTLLSLLPTIITTVLTLLPQLLQAGITLFLALIDAVITVLPELLTVLLGTVLPQVISTVLTMIPQLLTAAIDVFMALLEAVMEVLPQLITLIVGTVIPQIITTVLGMLPQLLSTAVQVFMALLTALIEILPMLVGFIVGTLIPTIVTSVVGGVGKLLSAGKDLMSGLWDGVKAIWPSVTGWFSDLPGKVLSALGSVGSWLYDSGRAIIQGLIDGIGDMVGSVTDAVGNVLSAARDLLPFSPAKKGPFSGKGWTLYSGRSITDALADGIGDNRDRVVAATRSVVDAASMAGLSAPSLRSNLGVMGGPAAAGPVGGANLNHYGDVYLVDEDAYARRQVTRMQDALSTYGLTGAGVV